MVNAAEDKRLHDMEMLIDDLDHRLKNALDRIGKIERARAMEKGEY